MIIVFYFYYNTVSPASQHLLTANRPVKVSVPVIYHSCEIKLSQKGGPASNEECNPMVVINNPCVVNEYNLFVPQTGG